MAKKTTNASVVIEQPRVMSLCLEVTGIATMIHNCFNQKALEQMLRKHMGLSVQREKKVPAECVELSIVRNEHGAVCVPSTAFKKAMLTASTQIKGLKKTTLRSSLFIEGGSVPITYSRMVPRMDMVRTSGVGRVPDVRFRASFEDWKARMIINFPDSMPPETVVDLLNRAGNVGVGEWRPEKDGTFGTFVVTRHISDPKEHDEVRKLCRPSIKPLVIPDWAMNAELSEEILSKIAHGQTDDGESAEEEA